MCMKLHVNQVPIQEMTAVLLVDKAYKQQLATCKIMAMFHTIIPL